MLETLYSLGITLYPMNLATLRETLSSTPPAGEEKAELTTLEKLSTTQKN